MHDIRNEDGEKHGNRVVWLNPAKHNQASPAARALFGATTTNNQTYCVPERLLNHQAAQPGVQAE
jgi:hypothetical protein